MNTKTLHVIIAGCTLILSPARAEVSERSIADQLNAKRVFPAAMQYVGEARVSDDDSPALLQAMDVFAAQGPKAGLAALEFFITAHPRSGWTPSLRVHLAAEYYSCGRYTAALDHWKAAWDALRQDPRESAHVNGGRKVRRASFV